MGTATVRRRHPALAAGLATLALALGFTAAPATAAPPPRDVDYVALGDSYTAGTGADTVGRTPLATWSQAPLCDQTLGGYVDIVDTSPIVDLVENEACHGALLTATTWDGVTSVTDQINQLTSQGTLSKDTELVSLTAGANDVGVNAVLSVCNTSTATACGEEVQQAFLAMPSVGSDIVDALAAIHRQAPRARIVVLGYPRLFNPAGATANQLLVNEGTRILNTTIFSAVTTANAVFGANAQYVDVTTRFAGHEVNTLDPWIFLSTFLVNGVPQVDPFDPRNFHPNRAGHQAYAAALLNSVNLKQLARP